MGRTSTAVKTRWNAEHYTVIRASIPKDLAERFKATADQRGESLASVIKRAIEKYIAE